MERLWGKETPDNDADRVDYNWTLHGGLLNTTYIGTTMRAPWLARKKTRWYSIGPEAARQVPKGGGEGGKEEQHEKPGILSFKGRPIKKEGRSESREAGAESPRGVEGSELSTLMSACV